MNTSRLAHAPLDEYPSYARVGSHLAQVLAWVRYVSDESQEDQAAALGFHISRFRRCLRPGPCSIRMIVAIREMLNQRFGLVLSGEEIQNLSRTPHETGKNDLWSEVVERLRSSAMALAKGAGAKL